MKNKRVTRITAALNSMGKDDIYSLMLFTLYKMQNIPDYLALSELSYLLDGDSLTKLLSYYGGMTITIPKLRDMRLVLKALFLYQLVNIEQEDFKDSLKAVASDEFTVDEIKDTYTKILEVMSDYEFEKNI